MKTIIVKTQGEFNALPERFEELTAIHIYVDPERSICLRRSLENALVSILGGTVSAILGGTVSEIWGKKCGPPVFGGRSCVMTLGPIGSRGGTLLVYSVEGGIHIQAGCWNGSIDEFDSRVRSVHGGNEHGVAYAAAVAFIRSISSTASVSRAKKA